MLFIGIGHILFHMSMPNRYKSSKKNIQNMTDWSDKIYIILMSSYWQRFSTDSLGIRRGAEIQQTILWIHLEEIICIMIVAKTRKMVVDWRWRTGRHLLCFLGEDVRVAVKPGTDKILETPLCMTSIQPPNLSEYSYHLPKQASNNDAKRNCQKYKSIVL